MGGAYYTGTTVTQSEVAQGLSPLAAANKKRSDALGGAVVGLLFGSGGVYVGIYAGASIVLVGLAFLAIGLYCLASVYSQEGQAVYLEAVAKQRDIDESWLCLRCGHTWNPFPDDGAKRGVVGVRGAEKQSEGQSGQEVLFVESLGNRF